MSTPEKISLSSARRIALAAQGFGGKRAAGVDAGHLRRTGERLAVDHIDSVNGRA